MAKVFFPPKRFAVVNVGNGQLAFIFNAAHLPAMLASGQYVLVGVCSEKTEHMPWAARNYHLDTDGVTTDFRSMVTNALQDHGRDLVVSCTAPTFLHKRFLLEALEAGARNLITDKPVCPTWEDFEATRDAIQAANANAFVTFNHNYMMPTLMLRNLVRKHGLGAVESISTGFLQSWLMTDPKIQQSEWRLKDPYGGLTDIGSHAGMLAAFILGQPIEVVRNVSMSTAGRHGAQCFDNGTMDMVFSGGIEGTCCFHQALPGHVDDLFAKVSFKKGFLPNGIRHVLFRMERSSDCIFTSRGNGDVIGDWHQWEPQTIVPCELLDEAWMAGRFSPPGHAEGWAEGWRRMFQAIAGEIWRQQGVEFEEELPANFTLPAPTISTAGEHSMRFIGATINAHKSGGECSLDAVG